MGGGKPEMLLGLDGKDPEEQHVLGVGDGVIEEHRLADTGVAAQHQSAAPAATDAVKHQAERLLLGTATDQLHAVTVSPRPRSQIAEIVGCRRRADRACAVRVRPRCGPVASNA